MRAALKTVPGVRNASVDFYGESAEVAWAASEANGLDKKAAVKQMVAAIEGVGFKAWPI